MFKLNRNRAATSGERIDFKFYHLKALQVPKGWDKLFVSIISVETGKTIAKTSKASVRNGTCQWTDNIAESIWVPTDDSSKELDDCFYKIVVAMGSARSGILGEATINITSYVQSTAASTVSIPLKKCNYGTTLQVKIQDLTSRTMLREDESKRTNLSTADSSTNRLEEDLKSDGDGVDSNTSQELGVSSHPEELKSQETTFSSFDSHRSSDSPGKYSPERKKLTGADDISGGANGFNGEEDSTYTYGVEDASQPNKSADLEYFPALSSRSIGSSKDLLEVAENTIKELRSEAKMWERNAQRLALDLDVLRKEFADQSKKQMSLEFELAEVSADRDGLMKEVVRMKLLVDKNAVEELRGNRNEGLRPIQELEEEIRFQKEINSDLALQLSRSQESNLELVLVLQEMEETLEKQRLEIEDLKLEQLKFNDMEGSMAKKVKEEYETKLLAREEEVSSLRAKLTELTAKRGDEERLVKEIEELKEKLQELERDCNELTEENLDLLFKLKDRSNGSLQGTAQSYEISLSEYSAKSVSSSDHENQLIKDSYDSYDASIRELESKNRKISEELIERTSEGEKLKEKLRAREDEIEDLRTMVSNLENERDETFKCLSDLQNDLDVLSSSFDSHVSANEVLERKYSEIERRKGELEIHVMNLESENEELAVRVSTLEDEVRSAQRERHGLLEEIDSLLKLNEGLKKQNLELKEFTFEMELKFEKLTDGFGAKVKELEEKLSSTIVNVSSKEKEFLSNLDYIHGEIQKSEEDFVLFNQLYVDQAIEVENLRNEIEELKEKVLEARNEKEKALLDAKDEISKISAERDELEISVRENRLVMEVKENEFKGLIEDVTSLGQEREKLLKKVRLGEEKFRTTVNELELRLTMSEYERDQLMSETTKLKVEIQKIEGIKNKLGEARSEKEKLEVDFKSALVELEELKGERNAFVEKISALEKIERELEDCKQDKALLEGKMVRLEKELEVNEAMSTEAMEVRSELSRVRRETRQLQQNMKAMEEERDELLVKSRALEDELKMVKEEKKKQKFGNGSRNNTTNMSKATNSRISPVNEAMNHHKSESLRSGNKQRDARRKPFLKSSQVPEVTKDPQSPSNASSLSDESFLVEATVETDDTCKIPNNRVLAETVDLPKRPNAEGEMVTKEKFERTKSSLESELVELRERYSQMSLRYAEVEAQREELVMRLKAARSAKRWFS